MRGVEREQVVVRVHSEPRRTKIASTFLITPANGAWETRFNDSMARLWYFIEITRIKHSTKLI